MYNVCTLKQAKLLSILVKNIFEVLGGIFPPKNSRPPEN